MPSNFSEISARYILGIELTNSLEKLKNLPGYIKVYPGHNETTTIEDEICYNPYLNE